MPEFEIGMSEKDFDKKLYPVINWSNGNSKSFTNVPIYIHTSSVPLTLAALSN